MRAPTLAALTTAVLLCGAPALAAAPADCQQLLELYRTCHRLGTQSDSAQTCRAAAQDLVARTGKPTQASRALTDLICTTGCEDATANQPPATAQEFTEAFCDTAPPTKAQGVRP